MNQSKDCFNAPLKRLYLILTARPTNNIYNPSCEMAFHLKVHENKHRKLQSRVKRINSWDEVN